MEGLLARRIEMPARRDFVAQRQDAWVAQFGSSDSVKSYRSLVRFQLQAPMGSSSMVGHPSYMRKITGSTPVSPTNAPVAQWI